MEFCFDDPSNVHVIIVHPDNDAAYKGVHEGFKTGQYGLKAPRPSICELFKNCASIQVISVKDEKAIGEEDLLSSFDDLERAIENIGFPSKITYDLTHSYRHVAFVILLQSFYLQTLKKGNVEIRNIFYAFAKQPLKEMDEVSYLDLAQLFLSILNTQVIKDAVHELRPLPLKRYADDLKKFKGFLNKTGYSTEYTDAVIKRVKEISSKLFYLQNGFFDLDDLTTLKKSLKIKKKQPEHAWDRFLSRFVQALFDEISMLLKGLITTNGFYAKSRVMCRLGNLVFERQDDIGKAFAFLRESIVQYFVEHLSCEVREADQKFSEFINQENIVPDKFKHIKELFADIGNVRNELQHLGMGKQPAALSNYQRKFKKYFEKLDSFFKEGNTDFIDYLSQI